MNKIIARFTTRPSSKDGLNSDLIIGTIVSQGELKPNTVYEIQKCFLGDELKIVEVGESWITRPQWNHTIGTIIGWGRSIFLTSEELDYESEGIIKRRS